jgi:DNA-3-methyladenine glycosylase I
MTVVERVRCKWALGVSPEYLAYHDREWGVPVRDDRVLFEFLILEGAQAGLSWSTVIAKRENYRAALHGFDPARLARCTARDVDRWVKDAGLIRHRGKLESVITNARAFLAVQAEHGSFAAWLWSFVDGRPVVNRRRGQGSVPARTALSDRVAKELKRRGFKFCGTTIVQAYLQAMGLINDHLVTCYRHGALRARHAPLARRRR